MPKPATGNWPRIQLSVHCRTCDEQFKLSIYYGESSIWNNTSAYRLAQWARHEDHDVEIAYQFYDGRKRQAAQ